MLWKYHFNILILLLFISVFSILNFKFIHLRHLHKLLLKVEVNYLKFLIFFSKILN